MFLENDKKPSEVVAIGYDRKEREQVREVVVVYRHNRMSIFLGTYGCNRLKRCWLL